MNIIDPILHSCLDSEKTLNSTESILQWVHYLNETTDVEIKECNINDSSFWYYDSQNGEIVNRKRSFFSIKGIQRFENGKLISEQPIIIQPEIGFLGIICHEYDGVLHFLMQAKIEPGNINCVQISPTIQATKSNFTRAHGGRTPAYLAYFENLAKHQVIYDQVQSEQAARFYKKRNRNIIMMVEEEPEVLPNYCWMTLGQIKKLMEYDNLVNMDTRTVLSGIPFETEFLSDNEKEKCSLLFTDRALFRSVFCSPADELPKVFCRINHYKMFHDVETEIVPLHQLDDWIIDNHGVTCNHRSDFSIRYYDISIAGREVQHWTQPLFKAAGMATFGLLVRSVDERMQFLVKIKPEIGSFDKVELGPAIQWEPTHDPNQDDAIEELFRRKLKRKQGIVTNVILSEEGGRFYHEQNNNIIIKIRDDELCALPDDYLWVSYSTLNYLVQVNNCLNIQLRNLLSLLKL